MKTIMSSQIQWKKFKLTDLFDLSTGDFNSFGDIDPGHYIGVSRVSTNNGVIGYYDEPPNGSVYPRGIITVSTTSGDAFVQLDEFIASDKVVLCKAKKPLRPSTLFFVAFMINHQKWRYSYGRSCFVRTLLLTTIELPALNDDLDEDLMEKIVEKASYWPTMKERFDIVQH